MNSAKAPGDAPLAPVRSVVDGIVWPGIAPDSSAHLLALSFQLDRSQWWTPEALERQQLPQLQALLAHAQASVPHYAATCAGLDPRAVDCAVFRRLPLLDRRTLQAEVDRLTSSRPPPSHGKVGSSQSSGSTGMPVKFLGTSVTKLFWEALTLREHFWHRRDFSGKLAAIRILVDDCSMPHWGAPVAGVFVTGPSALLNIRADVARQLDWLVQEKPDYLITHASNLGALAELSLKSNIRLPGLREARTFSETLRPDLRDTVRAAWGVEVTDVYSCSEAGVIALQCPEHEHYHVQSESLIVEILHPDGRPCAPGETGEVVLTTLHNFAMPLIRYRLGDYAEVGPPCPCGRGLPVLTRIQGRQRNMMRLPDGRAVWPSFPASVWRHVAPVEQFQLVQIALGRIEARYVMARELSASESRQLIDGLCERLGFPFRIEPVRVDKIERRAAHKFEDFISLID